MGSPLNVEPAVVPPGEQFTVTSPSGGDLPEWINCTIQGDSGVIQENIIETSGFVTLNVQDKFGGLTLEACDDIDCIQELCYFYNFTNIGSTDMDITLIERYYNGETFDLLPFVPVNPLPVGETTFVEEKTTMNICQEQVSCVDIYTEASPELGGDICFANDTYKIFITTPPPTPRPTLPPIQPTAPPTPPPTTPCTIDFTTACIPPPPATDCSAIPPAVEQCQGRPLMMGMLYNGGDCSQSFTVQDPDKFGCTDIGAGPPTVDGDTSYIVVTAVKDPSIVYHSDPVDNAARDHPKA